MMWFLLRQVLVWGPDRHLNEVATVQHDKCCAESVYKLEQTVMTGNVYNPKGMPGLF